MPPYFSHPSSLEHDTGLGHPERADRIRAIEAELERRDWCGFERREAPAATTKQLLAVHPKSYLELVRETCDRGGAFDLDTPTSPGSWEAALHGAGGACALAEALLAGEQAVADAKAGARPAPADPDAVSEADVASEAASPVVVPEAFLRAFDE